MSTKTVTDFNKNHPERKRNEIFLTNSTDAVSVGGRSSYEWIGWKTKRKGKVAYQIDGKPCSNDMFPVFIKKSEVRASKPEMLADYLPS
ncbi:MAG: hypothetical protein K0S38_924 [Candidatus Paceibacter sp.]|jgi:hypothetical protein|nr:hypothetical protein [Candidatus Paceibacter sp.]